MIKGYRDLQRSSWNCDVTSIVIDSDFGVYIVWRDHKVSSPTIRTEFSSLFVSVNRFEDGFSVNG